MLIPLLSRVPHHAQKCFIPITLFIDWTLKRIPGPNRRYLLPADQFMLTIRCSTF